MLPIGVLLFNGVAATKTKRKKAKYMWIAFAAVEFYVIFVG